jgi:threonine dehydratase
VTVTARDIASARQAIADVARRTPVVPSATLSERCGGSVVLKAESLQRTGSFKIRGALNKLAAVGDACASGVVCGSAGNHAQAVALAARERGVACEVFMPADASVAKAEGAQALGATVHLGGDSVAACVIAAKEHAAATGMTFVHPYDDADVIAGQGTLGLELLEDLPDLTLVLVPVGGGGLASGIAVAVKAQRPEVRVVGVRIADSAVTIADGIAVKHPGEITAALLAELVDETVVVEEDDVAEAIVLLAEKSKLVVEGAGAVGVAALLAGLVRPAAAGTTCAVLSGGNIDPGLLAEVARRNETEAGRRVVLFTRVPDRPGALARLLGIVAGTGANLVDVEHLREGVGLHIRETAVQMVLQTRGREHAERVQSEITAAGYETDVMR